MNHVLQSKSDTALLDGTKCAFPIIEVLHTPQESVIQVSIPAREDCGVHELAFYVREHRAVGVCIN